MPVPPAAGHRLRHASLSAAGGHVAVTGWRQDEPDAGHIELVVWTTNDGQAWAMTELDSLVSEGRVSVLSRVEAHGAGFAALLVVDTGAPDFPSFLYWSGDGVRWEAVEVPAAVRRVEGIAGTGGGLALFGRDEPLGGKSLLLVTADGRAWRRPPEINEVLEEHWGRSVSGSPDGLVVTLDAHVLAGSDTDICPVWCSRDAGESWAPLAGDAPMVTVDYPSIGPEYTVAVLAGTVELSPGWWMADYRIGWTDGAGPWRAFPLEAHLGIRSVSEILAIVAGSDQFVTTVEADGQRRLIVRDLTG